MLAERTKQDVQRRTRVKLRFQTGRASKDVRQESKIAEVQASFGPRDCRGPRFQLVVMWALSQKYLNAIAH